MTQHDQLVARFLKHVRKTETCWLWTASTANGYGVFRIGGRVDGRNEGAHRASYMLFIGAPGEFFVLHKCDVKVCVNPAHLFLGTQADNVADMIAKGRQRPRQGDRHPSAKLTVARVAVMRARYAAGAPYALLAEEFGVSRPQAHRILVSGKYWKGL